MPQPVPIEKRVAARVRLLREARGLSQLELARLAGTGRSQVAAVERGDRAPTIATLDAFARALRVRLSELVEDEQPATRVKAQDAAEQLAARLRARGPDYVEDVTRVVNAVDRLVRRSRRREPRPGSKKRSR